MTVDQSTAKLPKTCSVLDRLQLAQEMRGFSDTQLAQAIGISKSYISRIKSGSRAVIGSPILQRAASALWCNPAWLIDGVGNPEYRPVASGNPAVAKPASHEILWQTIYQIPEDACAALKIMDDADILKYLQRALADPSTFPEAAYGALSREWFSRKNPPTETPRKTYIDARKENTP